MEYFLRNTFKNGRDDDDVLFSTICALQLTHPFVFCFTAREERHLRNLDICCPVPLVINDISVFLMFSLTSENGKSFFLVIPRSNLALK